MRSPTAEDHSLDRRLADQAGEPRSQIHIVLKLEEALSSFGVHVIGNRRSSGPDRLMQHFLQRGMQAIELRALQSSCLPAGTNASAEQRLIRVNVPNAVQQLLIEQGCL